MQFSVFRLKLLPISTSSRKTAAGTILGQGDELVICQLAFAKFVPSKLVIHGIDSQLAVSQ